LSAQPPLSSPPLPRLPAKLFKDFRPTGSLYFILLLCHQYKEKQGWRRFELATPSKFDIHLELLLHLEQALLAQGFLRYPKVFFAESVKEELRQALRPLLAKLKATELVGSPNGATHVILPSSPPSGQDEDWFRTLDKTDKRALVHWWYYPDSYDEWVPLGDINTGDPEPPPSNVTSWRVTTRWIEDSARFSEWMNEEDYEPDLDSDSSAEPSKKRSAASPMPGSGDDSAAKRQRVSATSTGHPLSQSPMVPQVSHYTV